MSTSVPHCGQWLSKVLWLTGAVLGAVCGKFALQSPPVSLLVPTGSLGCAAIICGIAISALIVGGVAYRSLGFAFFAAGAAAGGWLGWFGLTSFGFVAVEPDAGCLSCTAPALPATDGALAAWYGAVAVCAIVGGLVLTSYQDAILELAASLTGAVLVAQGVSLLAASCANAALQQRRYPKSFLRRTPPACSSRPSLQHPILCRFTSSRASTYL